MDKAWFYTKALMLPYYLISRFSCHFVDIHFWTVWMIISHCIMLTIREMLQINKVHIRYNIFYYIVKEFLLERPIHSLIDNLLFSQIDNTLEYNVRGHYIILHNMGNIPGCCMVYSCIYVGFLFLCKTLLWAS